MKKAKILVPAMGMMLLSTAAAVSGTMAWFSANRAVEVQTNNFAVEAVDGSLTVAAANLVGTNITGTAVTPIVSVLDNVKLADASYDMVGHHLYTDDVDADDHITGYQDLGLLPSSANNNTWKAAGSSTTYYGVAFKLTFTYTFKADTRSLGLFFDADASFDSIFVNNESDPANYYSGSETTHTAKGFRMSFGCTDSFVWAPLRNSTDTYDDDGVPGTPAIDVPKTYINGTGHPGDIEPYTMTENAEQALYGNESNGLALATNGNQTTHRGYLGVIAKGEGTTCTLYVNCVVWYEGTDPEVINASSMDAVKATLKFYVRTIVA